MNLAAGTLDLKFEILEDIADIGIPLPSLSRHQNCVSTATIPLLGLIRVKKHVDFPLPMYC
jgi:hypothetical protein